MPVLALVALGAALARDASGVGCLPAWASALMQTPLVLVWARSQAGWMKSQGRFDACPIDGVLMAVVTIGAAVMGLILRSPGVFFTATTAFIAGQLLLQWLSAIYHRLGERTLEPAGILVLVTRPWLFMILVGTILLSLPLATHSWVPDYRHNFWLHVLNNTFASVSAACLVGVGVYDFGNDYTLFGQIILVVMTQLSGMAFAAVGLAAVQPFLSRVIRLRTVLLTALLLQLAAIAVMASSWLPMDAQGFAQRLWWGLVHAGSAIWNSGWMLRSDGLAAYLSDSFVFTAVTVLSIAGSLGIPILLDLMRSSEGKEHKTAIPISRPVWRRLPQWEAGGALAMLVIGAGLFYLFETPRFVPDHFVPSRPVDFGEGRVSIRDDIGHRARWSMSVFISASLRSAGLQSIPLSQGAVSWPTYGVMVAWMIVGGSAAGVAGGMRLSTLLLIAMSILFGRVSWATLGGPAVRMLLLRATLRWVMLWLLLNVTAVLVLAATTDGTRYERIFEAIAALNNVGLSTGLSLHLTWAGRLAMIGMMILGRLLPLAFWLGLSLEVTAALRTASTGSADAV